MSPNDPRHGTQAGDSAHKRDGEVSCRPCSAAKAKADKRRRVFGTKLTPVPDDVQRLIWQYSVKTLSRRTGVSECSIENMRKRGEKARAYPQTIDRLRSVRIPTDVGTVRRIRALARLGWSCPEIAARAGIPTTTVARLRDHDGRKVIGTDAIREAVASAYDSMSMSVPPLTKQTSRIVGRARRNGWPPPLAWDDIDNPDEQPVDWQYRAPNRAEIIADLDERGAGISEVCRVLKLSPKALERWLVRRDRWKQFKRLRDRERPTEGAA